MPPGNQQHVGMTHATCPDEQTMTPDNHVQKGVTEAFADTDQHSKCPMKSRKEQLQKRLTITRIFQTFHRINTKQKKTHVLYANGFR